MPTDEKEEAFDNPDEEGDNLLSTGEHLGRRVPKNTADPDTADELEPFDEAVDHSDLLQSMVSGLNANQNVLRAFGLNSGQYDAVHVLPIMWESEKSHGLKDELRRLSYIFTEHFGFHVERTFRIPPRNSQVDLVVKIGSVLKKCETRRDLFIIAYSGHGRRSEEDAGSLELAGDQPIQWRGIQQILEAATCDVGIIMNCCFAGSATLKAPSGKKELLAACSWASLAPAAPSYLDMVNVQLRKLVDERKPFSLRDLHDRTQKEARRRARGDRKLGNARRKNDIDAPLYQLISGTNSIVICPKQGVGRPTTSQTPVRSIYAEFKINEINSSTVDAWERWFTGGEIPTNISDVSFFTEESLVNRLEGEIRDRLLTTLEGVNLRAWIQSQIDSHLQNGRQDTG